MSRKKRTSRAPLSSLIGVAVLLILAVIAFRSLVPSRAIAPEISPPVSPQAPQAAPAGSWYQVYFTSPRYPDNPADHTGSLDVKLTDLINAATSSVDMAIYQLDLGNVTQALIDAKNRGATVRAVTDVDILDDPKENPSFKRLQAEGITVAGGNPNAIMHDKFVIVDRKAVWTGSWNFTRNDTYRYNNNGIVIQSVDLATNYTATFEKMWRDRRFGAARKAGGTTPVLSINGVSVENYFSPEDRVAGKLAARLARAQKSIDFLAYSFTDDNIGNIVRERARAGVRVRGVFENTGSETQFSEFGKMKADRLDVLQDGNPYLMHHKVFIVDGATAALGSYNFSENADKSNDENLLIIEDQSLAGQATAEFERVYGQGKR